MARAPLARALVTALVASCVLFSAGSDSTSTSTSAAASPVLLPVAQVGGRVTAMAADGARLYVARGTRIEIHPAGADTLSTPIGIGAPQAEAFTALAPDGDVLWALTGAPGGRGLLQAFDVHDPTAIHPMSDLPFRAAHSDLAVSAGRAWVASSGAGLDVVDISVPWRPRMRGRVTLSGPVRDLAAIDGGALVLVGPEEDAETTMPDGRAASLWRVTSVGNGPPIASHLIPLPRGTQVVAALGDRVVVAGWGQGLSIYDPGAARPLVASHRPRTMPPDFKDLVVDGDFAWLATAGGFLTFEGIETGRPVYDAERTVRSASAETPLTRLALSGGNLWAIEGGEVAGVAWVVSDASTGASAPARRDASSLILNAAAIEGDSAWLVGHGGEVRTWPWREPEGETSTTPVTKLPGALGDITVDVATGTRYVLGEAGVYALAPDDSEPRPIAENRPQGLERDYREALAAEGRLVLRVDVGAWDSVLVIDDRPPHGRNPVTLGLPDAAALAIDGRRAWVADGGSVVGGYDLRDPADPALVGEPRRRANARIRALAAAGPRLYVLDASGLLAVDDHSDPESPRILGSLDLGPSTLAHLALEGSRLWAAWNEAGSPAVVTLSLVDVSDPSGPVELARRTLSAAVQDGDVEAPGPIVTLDLAADDGAALLTLNGAVTTWRIGMPPEPPEPWAPTSRLSVPWVAR